MHRFFRDERGQGFVLFAIVLVVVLGFSALAIDVGFMMHKRAELQKAADAAALAGIMDVWQESNTHPIGINRARDYANSNGSDDTEAQVLTSYADYEELSGVTGAPVFLEVDCESTVNHFFGRVIGMDSSIIRANAVAVKLVTYQGESLPFVNLGTNPLASDGGTVNLTIWNKEGPGTKESIAKVAREYSSTPYPHFQVDYLNGIQMQNGKDHSIEDELQIMWEHYQNTNHTIYVLSLKPQIFIDKKFTATNVANGKSVEIELPECKELGENMVISRDDLVLLEVKWNSISKQEGNNTILSLEVVGIHEIGKIPDSYDGVGKIVSYLIK